MKSNQLYFSVEEYAAWAPGLETRDAWLSWAANPVFPDTRAEPKVQAMPSMLRRRADFLGKMALESAYQCLGELKDVPVVFCSRHGEVKRSVEMLTALAQGDPVSPATFSLSVHNAIAGLFSIARSDKASHVAISAQENQVENALVEACGLLADGAEKVLVVVYNNTLPDQLAMFEDEAQYPYSWAWLVTPPRKKGLSLSRVPSRAVTDIPGPSLPQELEIFRFFLNGEEKLETRQGKNPWIWSRHHG